MGTRKTGISHNFLIPPGETIAEVLAERGMTQTELAEKAGVSPAYLSGVIAGKEEISAEFACELERVFHVSQSFWMNLQANYNGQLREAEKSRTIPNMAVGLMELVKAVFGGGAKSARHQKI